MTTLAEDKQSLEKAAADLTAKKDALAGQARALIVQVEAFAARIVKEKPEQVSAIAPALEQLKVLAASFEKGN